MTARHGPTVGLVRHSIKIAKYSTELQRRRRLGCFKMETPSKQIQGPRREWMFCLHVCMRLVCTLCRVSVVPLAAGMQEDLKETLMECEGLNDIM